MSTTFSLVLRRVYTIYVFRECTCGLTHTLTWLQCTFGDQSQVPPLEFQEPTRPEIAARIRQMAVAAHLYDGDAVGSDSTSSDGFFETLTVTNSRRQTIVLVTSGNDSFAHGRRKELLDLIKQIETRLVDAARARLSGSSQGEPWNRPTP